MTSPATRPRTKAPARSRRVRTSAGWNIAFFLTAGTLLSRGLLELYVSKSGAYGLQVAAVSVFTLALLVFGSPRVRAGKRWVVVLAYGFGVVALLSAWASLTLNHIDYFPVYLVVTVFFAAMLVIYTVIDFAVIRRIAVGRVLALLGLILVGVAFTQQFAGLTELPGNDEGTFGTFIRPASLTGSFLHYPIAAALIVFLLLGIGAQRRSRMYTLAAGVVALGVAVSMSRSGLVILGVGALIALLKIRRVSTKLRLLGGLVLAGVVLFILFPAGQFLERALSIFDTSGAGNTIRIEVWTSVFDLWLRSPLFIGAHTGQFTNVTANLAGVDGSVAESGVLQILIGFGLLGLVGYYGLMFGTVSALPDVPPWFFAGAVAGIAQSVVYQSIEVLPFMILFAWFPLIASANSEPRLGGPDEVDTQKQDRVRRSVGRV